MNEKKTGFEQLQEIRSRYMTNLLRLGIDRDIAEAYSNAIAEDAEKLALSVATAVRAECAEKAEAYFVEEGLRASDEMWVKAKVDKQTILNVELEQFIQ